MLTGVDPRQLFEVLGEGGAAAPSIDGGDPSVGRSAEENELAEFVAVVLASAEDVWARLFAERGLRYTPPTLVLFTDMTESACGFGTAAVGPFYCPTDGMVYIDLAFYRDLRARFGAPGDFAQAYVVAHEVGHHVQNLLGISDRVRAAQARSTEDDANALSVRLELQADCLAGVWGHHAEAERHWLEAGDVEEALSAAAAIGDDRMQRQSGGAVQPESWTHGSSSQRVAWFRRGLESSDIDACDTFE
jgi:predicted metalloprotease